MPGGNRIALAAVALRPQPRFKRLSRLLLARLGRRRPGASLYYYPLPWEARHLLPSYSVAPSVSLPMPGRPGTRLYIDPVKGAAILVDEPPGPRFDPRVVEEVLGRVYEALDRMSLDAPRDFVATVTGGDPVEAALRIEQYMLKRRMLRRGLTVQEFWVALRNLSGLGPLLPLMFMEELTNIEAIVYRGHVHVVVEHERYGRLDVYVPRRAPDAAAGDQFEKYFTRRFMGVEDFRTAAKKLAELGGITVSAALPYGEATLILRQRHFRALIKYSERVGNPEVVMRAFRTIPFTPATYIAQRAAAPLDLVIIAYAFFKGKYIVLVTGQPGTGKTTLINVALHLPPVQRSKLVVIQDVSEFSIDDVDVSYLNTFEPQTLTELSEHVRATKKDLIKIALRQNAPAIAVNEVTSDADMVAFLDSKGVSGSITSIHSVDIDTLFSRIKGLVSSANLNFHDIVNNILLVAFMDKQGVIVDNVYEQRYYLRAIYLIVGVDEETGRVRHVPLMLRDGYNAEPQYVSQSLSLLYEMLAARVYPGRDRARAALQVKDEVEALVNALRELAALYERDRASWRHLEKSAGFLREWRGRVRAIHLVRSRGGAAALRAARPARGVTAVAKAAAKPLRPAAPHRARPAGPAAGQVASRHPVAPSETPRSGAQPGTAAPPAARGGEEGGGELERLRRLAKLRRLRT